MSSAFMAVNDYKKAKKYILNGIKLALESQDLQHVIYAYAVMSDYYYEVDEYDNALKYIEKVDSVGKVEERLVDSRDIIETSLNAGLIYTKKKEFKKAEDYLQKALVLTQKANDLDTQAQIFEALSELEETKGNHAKGLEYYKQYADMNDSVFNEEASRQLNTLKISYEIDKKDLEITTAKKNEEYSKLLTWTILLTALILILALVFLLFYSKAKLKSSKIATELTAKENKISQIEIENLEHEVQLKNKELADLFLHQYEKAQLLTEVIDNIDRSNDELKENLQEQLNKSEDWTNFKLHFDKVHEGFFQKLNELAPNLTTKDIRYCAYIRMNLTSKEIAIMLGISHRTVQGIRGRVRKKLGLKSSDDLVLYLMNL
ncbi:tetratricopeptide repeat protein [Kordia antarctica]|uniref:tetratricopeptide repeat protein n=1 Tax=Kordia antarctica TaxID=1218801 RepID=UPI001356971A|nr:LuxR family transcriptional regulator [Kordia antarctica]